MRRRHRQTILPEYQFMRSGIRRQTNWPALVGCAVLSGCAPVGPDFVKQDETANAEWSVPDREEYLFVPQDKVEWWQVFDDPVLDNLVSLAHEHNNNVRIAGLRVLESRAILGLVILRLLEANHGV